MQYGGYHQQKSGAPFTGATANYNWFEEYFS